MAELDDIKGIGNSIKAKLSEANIENVNSLANSSVDDLTEAGVGEGRATKILRRARRQGVVIKSGDDVAEEQEDRDLIKTGIDAVDQNLGGGLTPAMVGVSGEHKAGKTQFIFQALVSAASQTDDPAVYIETEEERFQAERIQAMVDEPATYGNIYKVEAYSLEQQMVAYDAVRDKFDDVSLVAVDSFVANFRLSDKFEGRADFKQRSNLIARHLQSLRELSNTKQCPVLLALQVYGNPKAYDGSVPIWGGALMHHTIVYLVHMSHSKGQLREAQVRGHPSRGDSETTVKITSTGVEDME